MIIGIGNDLVEIHRVRQAIKRNSDAFLKRVLSDEELKIAASIDEEARLAEFVAGRFAAKEAIAKATGLGLGKLGMSSVTVLVTDRGLVANWSEDSGLSSMLAADDVDSATALHVSITHAAGIAFAVAILERL